MFEPFKPWHLLALDPLSVPETYTPFLTESYGVALAIRGPAYTARDGEILLCGGIACDDSGDRWLWSFVTPEAKRQFFRLHRHVQRFIDVYQGPLTATADQCGVGCRWLELLGFRRTQEMKGFFPGCPDQFVYRRE